MRKIITLLTVFVFVFFSIAFADDYIKITPAASTSSGSSGHTIQDEGVSLTARTNLDFQGAGVTVTDGGGGPDSTIVTIPFVTNSQVSFVFDGGGATIITGSSVWARVPYDGTITGWEITSHSGTKGQLGVSIETVAYANWDSMNSIHNVRNPPFIKNANKNTSSSLGGWTTTLTKGVSIQATVVSCDSVTQSTVSLVITRSS